MKNSEHETISFTYRAAAVIVNEGCILLHRSEHDTFWSLPGGKVQFLEPSAEALRREMLEEMGVDVSVTRLLWIVENFFIHENRKNHELGFYYLAEPGPQFDRFRAVETFEGQEHFFTQNALRLIFRWFPLQPAVLDTLTIYPNFLRHNLAAIPQETVHVVNTSLE